MKDFALKMSIYMSWSAVGFISDGTWLSWRFVGMVACVFAGLILLDIRDHVRRQP